ncbi:MAG: sel1 repeat family protein [Pseudomonas prosekii]
MHTNIDDLTAFFNLLNSLTALIAKLNVRQENARKKAIELYNLGSFQASERYLNIGAAAGDRACQYALGEVLRRQHGSITEEAKTAYRLAAAQEDVYALLRLGDRQSLDQARQLLLPRIEQRDGEALLQMYELTKDITWLKQSARTRFPEAMYILALEYDRDSSLLLPGENAGELIDLWLERAAHVNFPLAMNWYTNRQKVTTFPSLRREWLEKTAALNDLYGVLKYGFALGHGESGGDPEYGYKKNYPLSYALISLVVNSAPEYQLHNSAALFLDELGKAMSQQEIDLALKVAQTWKDSHPPLSENRLTYHGI